MTASHPRAITVVVAADSSTDLSRRINKLSEAARSRDPFSAEDCYSEASDAESTSCALVSEQEVVDSAKFLSSTTRRRTSDGGLLRRPSEGQGRLSWLDIHRPGRASGHESFPLFHVKDEATLPEEMERLYSDLRTASLSATGPSDHGDFRASFIQSCQNNEVKEKLHLLRMLSSTLKAKKAELLAVESLVIDSALTASAYRKWRDSNIGLLDHIGQHDQAAGGSSTATVLRNQDNRRR
ncbi:interactor protein for cytohesin exchange factors 1-like [Aulostomus maculatus]